MKNELFTKGKEKSKKRDSKRTAPEQPPALKTPYKPHGQAADLINFLQQTRGNQQVQQMIESGELHAMLRVSQANDPLEREADRVADMVMDSFSPDFDVDEYINNTFAASNAMRGKTVDDLFPNRVKGLGGGKALPQTERTFFEERFGADFSGVRVYTGPTADEFARAINARAFTYRQDIVFADGEYAPGTREGRRLMAHELTHVLQDKQDVVQRQSSDYHYNYYARQSKNVQSRKTDDITIIKKPGIIAAPEGANIREVADSSVAPFDTLQYNTPVYVYTRDRFGWYYIRTNEGVQGYVAKSRVETDMPHANCTLYRIKEGEKAEQLGKSLAYTYKAGSVFFHPWQEIIVKILQINNGDGNPRKGIYTEQKTFDKLPTLYARSDINKIKLRAGDRIWLPDPVYIEHWGACGKESADKIYSLVTPDEKAQYIMQLLNNKQDSSATIKCLAVMSTARSVDEFIKIQLNLGEGYSTNLFFNKFDDWELIIMASLGPLVKTIPDLNQKRADVIVDYVFKQKANPLIPLMFTHFMFSTMYEDDVKAVLKILDKNDRLKGSILKMEPIMKLLKQRGIDTAGYSKESGTFFRGAWEALIAKEPSFDYMSKLLTLPAPYYNVLQLATNKEFVKALSNPWNWLDALLFNIPSTAYGLTVGTVQGVVQGVQQMHKGEWEDAGRTLIGPAINIAMIAGMVVGVRAGRGKTVKGPKGPNSFVIKGYTGPVPKEIARLNAILVLSNRANAMLSTIISKIGVKGLQKVAKLSAKSNKHAMFLYKHGARGSIALYNAGGNIAKATKLLSTIKIPKVAPIGTFPKSWDKFSPEYHSEFANELKINQKTKNLEPAPGLKGGEGWLFKLDKSSSLVLKRWFKKSFDKFNDSVNALINARKAINENSILKNNIEVVKIYKKGSDWVLRDYYSRTVHLKKALEKSTKAQKAYKAVINELKGCKNETLQSIYRKMNRTKNGIKSPSENFLWSNSRNKIIIIDLM